MDVLSTHLKSLEKTVCVKEGQTASKVFSKGTAHLYRFFSGEDVALTLAHCEWETGERDIRVWKIEKAPQQIQRLANGGLRLSISNIEYPPDSSQLKAYCVARQARVKKGTPNLWSNLQNATMEELEEGAGISDLPDYLEGQGALALGTKNVLLGLGGSQKNQLMVVFDLENEKLPMILFCLTRILPLLKSY